MSSSNLIEDTYAEAFDGLFTRIIITAEHETELNRAAYSSTALPSIVVNRSEGGIESFLSAHETPDGRKGAIVQFWSTDRETLFEEVAIRIRQGILVVPTTSVFNALDSDKKMDAMPRIGKCGGDYEWVSVDEREMINIPIMMGHDFKIERHLGYDTGVSGGNLWLMCDSVRAGIKAGHVAVGSIKKVEGAITPFDICSAGSKPDSYPRIGPTTNHPYCPTLRGVCSDSKVPEGVESIPEVVINGISLETVGEAMRCAIESVRDMKGIVKISAGNYGGKLGKYKIYLREVE